MIICIFTWVCWFNYLWFWW